MDMLLSVAIKGALIAAVGLIALRYLRSHSAATRHWVLASTLAAVAVLPLLQSTLPPLDPGFMPASGYTQPARTVRATEPGLAL